MPEIDLPQGRIAYADDGEPGAPAVVFVHGYAVDGELWRETAHRLVTQGFRCLRPTLPLGAHTVPAGRGLTTGEVVELLASFLSQLGLDDVTVVGNDSGGALTQLLADRHPRRIGRLVLTNCDAFEAFPPRMFSFFVHLGRRGLLHPAFRIGTPLRLTPLLFQLLTARGFDPAQVDAWIRPYLHDRAIQRETDRFVASIDKADTLAVRHAAFDKPVLLAWGMRDRFFTPALGRRLAAAYPRSRFVELPEARTFVPHDEPARLAELIEEHVRVPAAV